MEEQLLLDLAAKISKKIYVKFLKELRLQFVNTDLSMEKYINFILTTMALIDGNMLMNIKEQYEKQTADYLDIDILRDAQVDATKRTLVMMANKAKERKN